MAGKIESECAKKIVEQAKECLREGDFAKALSLIGQAEKIRPTFNGLNELRAISELKKSPDWYRILQIEDSADGSTIKRRYRQLALLLHPDKNKNVRAEEAFKLVSEAYACLSERSRRKIFNLERSKVHCQRCFAFESSKKDRKQQEDVPESQNLPQDTSKSEQERLQEFRDRARARVTSLAQDLRMRRSRWNSDLDTSKDKYHNKRIDRKTKFPQDYIERPLKESDVFQPSTNCYGRGGGPVHVSFHVPQEPDLMTILRGSRKSRLPRETRPEVFQSLDGFLNKLKAENSGYADTGCTNMRSRHGLFAAEDEEDTPGTRRHQHRSSPRDGDDFCRIDTLDECGGILKSHSAAAAASQRKESAATAAAAAAADKRSGTDVTSRFFSKRVSFNAEAFPARKLFKEDDREEPVIVSTSQTTAGVSEMATEDFSEVKVDDSGRFSGTLQAHEEVEFDGISAASNSVRRRKDQEQEIRGNAVDSSSHIIDKGCSWKGACRDSSASKQTMLREQKQKSEELLKTLERLREEAKSVAATLEKLKQSVSSTAVEEI